MLKNYIRIAWRNIVRHKVYTTINILGLALGICACLVIWLVTSYEFSFDRFHPNGDRIYRIVGEVQSDIGEKMFMNSVFSDVAGFEHAIPGFEAKAGFHGYDGELTIPAGEGRSSKKFGGRVEGSYEAATILTGPGYFSIFKYEWLAGNAAVLNEPFRLVLAESAARKYFGAGPLDKMLGREVIYDDSIRATVGGIVKDWAGHTDLAYTNFLSIGTAPRSFLKNRIPTEDWSSLQPHASQAFVLLEKGTNPASVNGAFAAYIDKYVKRLHSNAKIHMYLQPLSAMHFTGDFHRGDDGDDFRKPYMPTLYVLMGLAVFILVIAAVNFINLSTAQSIQRAKEIGIRKVMGSSRRGLVMQFLMETGVLTLLAAGLSVCMVRPVLGAFKDFIPEGVRFHMGDPATLLFLLLVIGVTTLLAGFYPARVLAAFLTVKSLKGAIFQKGSGQPGLRKVLIVFQFTISLVFIIGALVIGNQISFMRDADKGFDTDAIVTVNRYGDHRERLKLFAASVEKIAGVGAVAMQGNSPMGFAHMGSNFTWKGRELVQTQVSTEMGDAGFIPLYKMRLLAGRNILPGDSVKEVVINAEYARVLGFSNPSEALGKMIYETTGKDTYNAANPFPIVGVVADFMENSFHEAMKPVVIMHTPERERSLAIKLLTKGKQAGDTKTMLAAMEKQWKAIYPASSFDYSFLNESIGQLFGQEEHTAWLVNMAMAITIFISCMGLFGLGLFTAQRRTREIGIRKVLGAGVANITAMLTRDFLVLVGIAFLIAAPIAGYAVKQWLMDFVYRVPVGWGVFAIAGAGAGMIALLTVSVKAIGAAMANPVKSLRSE